jgi:hypothetical protein
MSHFDAKIPSANAGLLPAFEVTMSFAQGLS